MQRTAWNTVAFESGATPLTLTRTRVIVCGRILSIDTGDETAAGVLEATYGTLRPAPDRAAHHSAFVRRQFDGRLHVRFDRNPLAGGERAARPGVLPAYYALREIFARFCASIPGNVAFYSAAVAVNGGAVMLAGPASTGKSLLALHLARRGAHFLGDETAMLDMREGHVRALARRPALRESALAMLPADLQASVENATRFEAGQNGRFWYALDETALGGIRPDETPHRLTTIVLLRDRAGEHALHEVPAAQALPLLLQRAYSRPFQLLEMSAVKRALRNVRCFELTPGDPQTTAEAILREVR